MASLCIDSKNLALLGGPQAIVEEVDPKLFHWPITTEEDEQAVLDVIRAGNMSAVDITKKFEAEYAAWIGCEYALGTCNGTAALLEAFWACGVGAGDEIICPAMTYWASAAPALALGASVNFADIEPDTLCLDPDDIEHRIGKRTKAIVVVHYAGHPADMDRIMPIARKHGVKVIEDVSHAHGSLYKNRMCGTLGDIAAASMMAGKSFAIGEGGMLTTSDRELYERAVAFAHYERTGGPSRYAKSESAVNGDLARFAGIPIGAVKHRLNQTASAMGRVQLKYYPQRIAEIQRAVNRFWSLLEDVPGLRPHRVKWADSTMGGWYHARGLYDASELHGLSCEKFCEAIRAEGFADCTAGANAPLNSHAMFHDADLFNQGQPTVLAFGQRDVRQGPGCLPVSDHAHETVFGIPWFKHDDVELIEMYAAAYRKVASHAEQLAAS